MPSRFLSIQTKSPTLSIGGASLTMIVEVAVLSPRVPSGYFAPVTVAVLTCLSSAIVTLGWSQVTALLAPAARSNGAGCDAHHGSFTVMPVSGWVASLVTVTR